ncbi:hypothetical protein [Aquamicrobium sp.]|uniref:hypothetical protein n=1 Tax=Aquamicrobium sp. TaxID=1872579 RepID=UPI00258B80B5|nr:hypothetical protein [Aquamicrobium sp.]MCK9549134.1 hypothetical protein [Aquamicrobium sp.]
MLDDELTETQETGESGDPAPKDQQTQSSEGEPKAPATEEKTEPAKTGKTIVAGADAEEEAKAKEEQEAKDHKPYWPDDWREKMAEHYAAGDKKLYQKELNRLKRFTDPTAVYGMGRELEGKFTSGGLVKIPGKDAKPEEKQAFWKQLGVPENAEEYFEKIQLENGAVIGEADKPLVNTFAQAVHKAGATPEFVSAALNWYYQQQEQQAAELDEQDETFRVESERALKEEFGPAFKRRTNAIGSLFSTAPGGSDIKNENGLFARLMGGRTADGRIIGNDPDMVRWLSGLVSEVNPAATVVEGGDQSGQSVDEEIAKIEKIMRTDRREYNRTYADRYRELLGVREKLRARGA